LLALESEFGGIKGSAKSVVGVNGPSHTPFIAQEFAAREPRIRALICSA
jgi:hypothetical protein